MQSLADELALPDSHRDVLPPPDAADFSQPDWARITERVVCPLCEYDLRGLSDGRCPECGYRFAWSELLDPKIRRHEFLFEHQPRHNLWSFWKTIRATLRPRKFWRSVYPTQPIRVRRLVAYWLFAALVLILSAIGPAIVQVTTYVNSVFRERAMWTQQINEGTYTWAAFPVAQGQTQKDAIIQRYGSVDAYVETTVPIQWNAFWPMAVYAVRGGATFQLTVLLWPWATLLSLMIFRISMRRARIKPVHVLRCVVYSFDAVFWLGWSWLLVSAALGAMAMLHVEWDWLVLPLLVVPVVWLSFVIYDLIIAYRTYLRFDHPIATVLASQLIVALLAVVLLLQLYNAREGLSL